MLIDARIQVNRADPRLLVGADPLLQPQLHALQVLDVAHVKFPQKLPCRRRGQTRFGLQQLLPPSIPAQDCQITQMLAPQLQIINLAANGLAFPIAPRAHLDLEFLVQHARHP